jgi:hypothetical protein
MRLIASTGSFFYGTFNGGAADFSITLGGMPITFIPK